MYQFGAQRLLKATQRESAWSLRKRHVRRILVRNGCARTLAGSMIMGRRTSIRIRNHNNRSGGRGSRPLLQLFPSLCAFLVFSREGVLWGTRLIFSPENRFRLFWRNPRKQASTV